MNVNGKNYRTIWPKEENENIIEIIDQRFLPHKFVIEELKLLDDFVVAIKDMHVRGAGLIGATAGYGMFVATLEAPKENFEEYVENAGEKLKATRPTAVNLACMVERQLKEIKKGNTVEEKIGIAKIIAKEIADEDANYCKRIGEHGVKIIEEIYEKKKETVNILTHCNAGWLAFVDYGSALSPIFEAKRKGIPIKVWVDETRPRNQGAKLTAWELLQENIEHYIIADNVGGHLMQNNLVDMIIVGTDRTASNGDVANKIGTYLKALAAKDNNIPFYVALPSTTFDFKIESGKEIPIEERNENEVKYVDGLCEGKIKEVLICSEKCHAKNYGFDVTPNRLITGLITERGICEANKKSILELFKE
jgi:methylthioribose-1-phosphate isomerase